MAEIGLESFGSPKLQTLYHDIVVDFVVIRHHMEVAEEDRKRTQMVSGHKMAKIGVVDRVDPSQ